ncbi:hypothetical protein PLICRDRAFT_693873 [Plicaturopsis crispa FD-325 SS-3]|nr:hypothetical protein PLICRDRAFT_693873 [Plicaturopsis crispa FD-325 SS-3]
MLPLLRCMAPDLWNELELDSGKTQLTLKRPILQDDWHRFRRYGNRVRTLEMPRLDHTMSPELSFAMMVSAGPDGVLPNLHTLWWRMDRAVLLPGRLGPRLHHLHLEFNYREPTLTVVEQSILHSLPLEFPNVKELDLEYDHNPGAAVVDLACGWPRLEFLQINFVSITYDTLRCVSQQLQSLRCLRFDWDADSLGEGLYFRQLREVAISISRRDAMGPCYDLLRHFEAPELNNIEIRVSWNASSRSFAHLFLGFLGNMNHSSVASIKVDFSMRGPYDAIPVRDPSRALCRATIHPIFSCRHLTVFNWACFDGFDLDDGDLMIMAASWPSLQRLDLSSRCGWSTPSRITLQGLVRLLQLCPDLQQLGIVIDATKVDASSLVMGQKTKPNMKIDALRLGNSPITDVDVVADALSYVLPRLFDIRAWDRDARFELYTLPNDEADQYKARWVEVQTIVRKRRSSR